MVRNSGLAKKLEFAGHITPLNPHTCPRHGAAGHCDHRVYALLLGDETTVVENHCRCAGPARFGMIGVKTAAQRKFNRYIGNDRTLYIPCDRVEMNHIAGSGLALRCSEFNRANRVGLYVDRCGCLDFIDGRSNRDGPRFQSSDGAKSIGFCRTALADCEYGRQVMALDAGFINAADAKRRGRTRIEWVRYAVDLNATQRRLRYDDFKLAANAGLPRPGVTVRLAFDTLCGRQRRHLVFSGTNGRHQAAWRYCEVDS